MNYLQLQADAIVYNIRTSWSRLYIVAFSSI